VKTYLIALEPHDDLLSVRDKMAWGKTTRLLLIWPEGGDPLLDRRLDLLLLKRRATELGSQLALVTRAPEVKSHARELGIPTFRTAREAQAAHWRIPRETSQLEIIRRLRALHGPKFDPSHTEYGIRNTQTRIPYSVFRIPAFLLALLAVAALAGMIFPSATITLAPATQTQTLSFTAHTSPSITTPNATGDIPAQPIHVIIEGRTAVETTGRLTLPENPATGRVTFTNLTDVTVIVPAGTVVQTTGFTRFATDQQVQVPAQAGGTANASVTATQPGTQGNTRAETIQFIEGTLGLQLTVTNAEALTGGTDQTVAAPTELDRRRAYRQLLASLSETAMTEIATQLAPGDLLLNPTPILLGTLAETYTPAETVPSDFVEVTLRLEFQSFALTQADLLALSQTVLDANLEPAYLPVPDTLTFQLLTNPQPDAQNTASWEMQAERQIIATLPARTAVELAVGQPPAAVQTRLTQALPLAAPPVIQLFPTWWPRLPFLPYQIEIIETP
jgi:hypothetical protein